MERPHGGSPAEGLTCSIEGREADVLWAQARGVTRHEGAVAALGGDGVEFLVVAAADAQEAALHVLAEGLATWCDAHLTLVAVCGQEKQWLALTHSGSPWPIRSAKSCKGFICERSPKRQPQEGAVRTDAPRYAGGFDVAAVTVAAVRALAVLAEAMSPADCVVCTFVEVYREDGTKDRGEEEQTEMKRGGQR